MDGAPGAHGPTKPHVGRDSDLRPRERMASRVIVYECCVSEDHPALTLLKDEGFELVACEDGKALLEELVQRRPDVLIYGFRAGSSQDLGLLQLVRRAAPELPLVLLASEGSLSTRRLVQSFRPIYYAVCPVEGGELVDAVRAALARPGRLGPDGSRKSDH
jgi:DNA-binding NtrC family response regulator